MTAAKLLVTGASGKLGQQVVKALLNDFAIDPSQLIVTTRNASSLAHLAAQGIEVREADFAKPESLEQAFQGADSLLLISIDAIGQRSQAHANAVAAAAKVGVKHLSYTSMPSATTSPVVFAYEHEASEQAIAGSSIANWTILRNNWYFENLPEFNAATLQSGTWLSAAADGRTSQLSRDDLALAAAASLVKSLPGKQTLTLNGPEALSADEMAAKINQVVGTDIQVMPLSDEALKSQLESFGLPEGVVAMVTTMDQHARGGFGDGSSEDYVNLTGRQPQAFTQWLEQHKAELVAAAKGA